MDTTFNRALLTFIAACLVATDSAFAAKPPTDVTDKVIAAVKDESLSIPASNDLFGDTAFGVPKKLTVEYQAGDQNLTSEADVGGRVQIMAPAGRKLIILKATYGPADGSTPVNAGALTKTPGEVLETLPGFKIEHVQQISYVTALRNIKTGWTENLRRDYLAWWNGSRSKQHPLEVVKWFSEAGVNFNNGASFDGFVNHALQEAKASMTPAEISAMGDLTKNIPISASKR